MFHLIRRLHVVFFLMSAMTSVLSGISSALASNPVVFEQWYEIKVRDTQVGTLYEKIEKNDANKALLYYSTQRALLGQPAVITQVDMVSISQYGDLQPMSYNTTRLIPNAREKTEGFFDAKTGTMSVETNGKKAQAVSIPKGTVFMGLFPLLYQRQGALDRKKTYEANFYSEEQHEVQAGRFRFVEEIKKENALRLNLQVGESLFDAWMDPKGHFLKTSSQDGSLVTLKSTEENAWKKWSKKSLFDALSKVK